MIQQSKAKIFLGDHRGLNESSNFRSRHTFNFDNYFNEHKQSFGDLYLLNDDTLAGSGVLEMQAAVSSYVVLIPVAGAIAFKNKDGDKQLIAAGQIQVIIIEKGTTIEISNPFIEEHVNFLQLWIRADKINKENNPHTITYNDVNENINTLVNAFATYTEALQLPFNLSIGKFSGRGETTYTAKNKNAGLFLFVIAGAFEAQGRLVHAGDSLALWEAGAAEMEALSNDAIMMALELPQAHTA